MRVRKAMLPPRFRDTQEEEDAAEDVAEPLVQSGEVVAGAKRQHHVEEEVGQGQVEEEDGAALPGPHVPAEDPEGKAVAQDAQQELSDNQRRQCSGEQLTLVGTADVVGRTLALWMISTVQQRCFYFQTHMLRPRSSDRPQNCPKGSM